MPEAWLTIDDGPSECFEKLCDALHERGIEGLFFNRGDRMEERPDAVLHGIGKGHVMANHAFSHRRFSRLSFEEGCAEIDRTEAILDDLYARAGVPRHAKYFRFPYMDRGMGPCLTEPAILADDAAAAIDDLLTSGLGHVPATPSSDLVAHKRRFQGFLKARGFSPLPAQGITLDWYADTEMAEAVDCLCTFSTSDWAISRRHIGKQGFSGVEDLKRRIDDDPWLHRADSRHVILIHDQEDIHSAVLSLVDYLAARGFEFLTFS